MDPQQIELVQSTFHSLDASDDFTVAFYDQLFALDGSLRDMFPADMAAQRQKLFDELHHIVDSLGNLTDLVARTTELGRSHVDHGVQPHHYDLVLDALLHAMARSLGDQLTEAGVVAWRRAYHLVAETMLYGATHPV
jgi:nitric oxide dioxygenase